MEALGHLLPLSFFANRAAMCVTAVQVSRVRQQAPLPNFQEQGLCVGNSFWVTATNGMDICRRLNLLGYCRCTELLSDNVEDIVLSSGGEVVAREYKISRCVVCFMRKT